MTSPAPDPGPARGRRLGPDARREEILDAAAALFGERPFGAVSTTELAARAGVARGLIHHYFGTKRGLFLESVRRMLEIPSDAVAALPPGDRDARVAAAVDWFLDAVERDRGLWLAVGTSSGGDPDVEAVLTETDEIAVDRVLSALAPDDPDVAGPVRARVRAFFGMARAASREWLVRGALDRTQTRELLVGALRLVLEPRRGDSQR